MKRRLTGLGYLIAIALACPVAGLLAQLAPPAKIGSQAAVRLDGNAGGANLVGVPTGAAGRAGTATLVAGTVTVSTTAVTAGSRILATVNTPGGATQGVKLAVPTRSAGVSFVINAVDNTGATVATDVSTVDWIVVN